MTIESRERTAGVVLAYHAERDIIANIDALLAQADEVFVVDNSPDPTDPIMRTAEGMNRVTVLAQAGNVGVAAGFNSGMRVALDAGFDYVWIFDQDSTVVPGMLAELVGAYRAAGEQAGVVGPALRSHATGLVYRRESGAGAQTVQTLISSGSLFARRTLDRIGLHDEALFIDYVDHDISLRAHARGLRNIKVYSTHLEHRFGDSDAVRLFGRRVYLAHYSPLRQYYMSRNRVILLRRYGVGRWFWEDLGFTIKSWIKVLLLERDRGAKIRAFFRGWRDGVRYDIATPPPPSTPRLREDPGVAG